MSLEDLYEQTMQRLNVQPEEERRREITYRRGFHQGWDDAIDRILRVLNDDSIAKDDVYALIVIYVNRVAEWRNDQDNHPGNPPLFNLNELKAMLKKRREDGLQ